jgi:antitoxin ParD1/3/4
MNVSLTVELETWVQEKVAGGLYRSASEVVRDSLRLLRERDQQRQQMVQELRGELALGVGQLDRGKSRDFTPKVLEQIRRAGRERVGE